MQHVLYAQASLLPYDFENASWASLLCCLYVRLVRLHFNEQQSAVSQVEHHSAGCHLAKQSSCSFSVAAQTSCLTKVCHNHSYAVHLIW